MTEERRRELIELGFPGGWGTRLKPSGSCVLVVCNCAVHTRAQRCSSRGECRSRNPPFLTGV